MKSNQTSKKQNIYRKHEIEAIIKLKLKRNKYINDELMKLRKETNVSRGRKMII